jgi:pimeloyl-ACP methyl ester carboxylesterase
MSRCLNQDSKQFCTGPTYNIYSRSLSGCLYLSHSLWPIPAIKMPPEPPVLEAELDFLVPSAGKPCKTWYTLFGTLNPGIRPLVCLHSGPSVAHNYIRPVRHLATSHSIPVILYDQLGCGKSTHLPDKAGDGTVHSGPSPSSLQNSTISSVNSESRIIAISWDSHGEACWHLLMPFGGRRA